MRAAAEVRHGGGERGRGPLTSGGGLTLPALASKPWLGAWARTALGVGPEGSGV